MKTYKLLNAIRYVDARTALRFIDASVGNLQQTVVNSLGKFARTSIPGNASQTFGTEITSICKSIIAGDGVGIADKIDAFAKSLKNFRNKNISAKNVIDGAKINTALQELKKQAAVLARGGAPAKSENRSAGWGKSKVRSPSNVSMVGRPEFVTPSKTWASLKSSVEKWAQQPATYGVKLGKDGKLYYNGKLVNENNIPSSMVDLVNDYPNKKEAIEGIKNILKERLEKRRMSIVNAKKNKQGKYAATANAYRLRNKNKLDPGLEEEFRNEGLSHSKSNYQRAIAGKPDGARQRKIELAMDISRVIGNRGAGLDNVDERIDMTVARDALANIKSGISSLKLGRDREARDAFYQAKRILNKTGNNKDVFPNLHKKLNSLIMDSRPRHRDAIGDPNDTSRFSSSNRIVVRNFHSPEPKKNLFHKRQAIKNVLGIRDIILRKVKRFTTGDYSLLGVSLPVFGKLLATIDGGTRLAIDGKIHTAHSKFIQALRHLNSSPEFKRRERDELGKGIKLLIKATEESSN